VRRILSQAIAEHVMNNSATPHPLLRCGPSSRHSFQILLVITTVPIALAACTDQVAERLDRRRASIADQASVLSAEKLFRPGASPARLRPLRAFELRENQEVVNVAPEAFRDPAGGFLVSDEREAQIRRYADDGKLLWHAGRRGRGPGEFEAPTAVVRLRTGEVAAFDRGGRLTVFDGDGQRVLRTVETRLRHLSDAALLDDGSLLVAAIVEGDWDAPRLHVVDPVTGAIRPGAFAAFTPFRRSPAKDAATVAGWTRLSVRDGRVAAVFATSDTVYVFDTQGRHLRDIPIPFTRFRPAPRSVPRHANTDPRARMRWLSSFDLVADVHWLPDGDLLVPFQSIDGTDGTTRHWKLLRMTSAGGLRFELPEASRLLEVDGWKLYLLDPQGETPNQWIEARLPS
jgi:hypothetical protein